MGDGKCAVREGLLWCGPERVAAKMASYVFKLRSAGRVESAMHFADISVCSSKWYFDIKVTNANAKKCSV